MKIAVFVTAFPVWTETFILRQITGLIDRGHDVDIYAVGSRHLSDIHAEVDNYRLIDRTTYLDDIPKNIFMRFLKVTSLTLSHNVLFRPRVWQQIARIPKSRRKRSPCWNMARLLKLVSVLAGRKPYDVIHCQFGTLGPPVLFLKQIGALSGKLVTSFRGHDATQYAKVNSGMYDELFSEGDLFLPVSEDIKRRLVKMGCNENRIEVLHSGIDCSKFEFYGRRRGADEPTRIISIARLVEMKGIAYAIEAIAKIIKTGRPLTYTVIGDGELREKLTQLIHDLGVSNEIKLLGWMNHEAVNRLLQQAHILVAPSITATRGETEGIPNAAKEAMAMGLPVVSTLHGGNAELIEDSVSGFLVAERDADALAERLAYLCDHPERWPGMGQAGRAHIEAEFDIETLNNQLADLYQS